ncbi:hypothetical protein BCR42DRAFT_409165 [Absidia repens]|uniref:PH domain-containing protein n=1 Tax=Absidia repens TaxID=90262 RepID=A0A1X2IQT6_9FUNG|nr:hypothetical protein BCR42DRAFT_409165 [Absidia repens]
MNSHTIGKYAMQYLLESQAAKKPLQETPSSSNTVATKKPSQPPIQQQQQQQPRRWWSRSPRPEDILTKQERKILKAVKKKAQFLDRGISLCCIQIGFDGLIGLIPVVGDFIGLIFALFLVEKAMEANLPSKLVNQMLVNIAVDFFIGLVPIIGDILDIMYKCNTRNALLLEEYLIERRHYQLRKQQDIDTSYTPKATSSSTDIPHAVKDTTLQRQQQQQASHGSSKSASILQPKNKIGPSK